MKRTLTRIIPFLMAMVLILVSAIPALGAGSRISATLEPSNIAIGEQAQLTVTLTGAEGDEPLLPHVDGLEFSPAGQSSQYQSINGVVTSSTSQIYLVTATRAGHFTIPPIVVGEGRDAHKSQSFTLVVTDAGISASPGRQPAAAALTPPSSNGSDDDQTVTSNGKQVFLRLVTPRKQIMHVGELVPVKIKAYFVAGLQASINGVPSLSSDAFTLNALDNKPEQTEEDVDGHTYEVLTWTPALTAVKAGDFSLTMHLPVTVTIQQKRQLPRGFPSDPFNDDSFFDGFFGNSVEKQLNLTSDAETLTVQRLPLANQPSNFNGALGQFDITAQASPDHVSAGDPITLRLTISGRGNFDRVTAPLLNNSPNWKTYKPVGRFSPADSVGLEGTKTFEQAVVPLQSGKVQIPPLSFSYFDTQTDQYNTRKTAPIEITVAAASTVAAAPAPPVAAPAALTSPSQLQPNRVEPGTFTTTLRPLFLRPLFVCGYFVTAGVMAGILGLVRLKARRAGDFGLARARNAQRAIQDQLAAMDSAMQKAETVPFFVAARRALQQRLGEQWNLPPETITLSEINSRLNGNADGIRPVFQMADQVAYSHENLPSGDLAGWKRITIEQLQKLETR